MYLFISAPLWKLHRKIIDKIFAPNCLRIFFDIFVKQSLEFTDEVEKIEQNGNEIIFHEIIIKRFGNIAVGKNKFYYLIK